MSKEAIKMLKALYLQKHYSGKYSCIPEGARFAPNYSDSTSNGLQRCIVDFLKYNDHQCERVSCTGRYIDNTKLVTDCIGRVRRIGSGKWIKSSMQRGTSDLSAIIYGRSVKIEIKIGADKMSQFQKQYQKEVEQAGGLYVIAKDLQSFIDWYKKEFEA